MGNLGLVYYKRREFKKAVEYFREQYQIAEKMQDVYSCGIALGNLGAVYYRVGQYEKIMPICEAQLGFTRQVGDRSGEPMRYGIWDKHTKN